MILIRNISAFLIAVLILVESIGVQIIKDICTPCHDETVAVQLLFTQYESDCDHGCKTEHKHHENDHYCKTSHEHHDDDHYCMTNDEHDDDLSCNTDHKHPHEREVRLFSNNPDFLQTNTSLQLKYIPVLLAIFDWQPDLQCKDKELFSFFFDNKFAPPENDRQSFLCTYII